MKGYVTSIKFFRLQIFYPALLKKKKKKKKGKKKNVSIKCNNYNYFQQEPDQ